MDKQSEAADLVMLFGFLVVVCFFFPQFAFPKIWRMTTQRLIQSIAIKCLEMSKLKHPESN